jgi:hypothetical protein
MLRDTNAHSPDILSAAMPLVVVIEDDPESQKRSLECVLRRLVDDDRSLN